MLPHMHPQIEAPPVQVVSATRCGTCAHDLGSTEGAPCPNCGSISPTRCRGCGYHLAGLPISGTCPECGMPVLRSLQGRSLIHSGPDYLAMLHRGVFLIVAGIIAELGISLLTLLVQIWVAFSELGDAATVAFTGRLLNFGTTIAILIGWWMFSTPDPAVTEGEKGTRSRRILRGAVIASVVVALIDIFLQFGVMRAAGVGTGGPVPLLITSILFGLVNWVVIAVKYFAAMQYIRWIAPRIPDMKIEARARSYLYILPLLATIGVLLLGFGPLIALVLYLLLLDSVRQRLKRIRAEQAAA